MKKKHLILYWIATLWLALGMASTGIVQMLQMKEQTKPMIDMGFPAYFLIILGVWKLLGVVAVLVPKFPVIKEWAYAGFFFTTTGAIVAHLMSRHSASEIFPALLLLILTLLSWYFRPPGRTLVPSRQDA